MGRRVGRLERDELLLLVDDERDVRAGLAGIIEHYGQSVVCCEDIESAQLMVEHLPISGVLADVRLSGPFAFEGLDFIDHVSSHLPSAGVVLMTGNASSELSKEAMLRGASLVLSKPFSTSELFAALEGIGCSGGNEMAESINVPSLEAILSGHLTHSAFHPIMRLGHDGPRAIGFEALTRIKTSTPLKNPEVLFQYARRKSRLQQLEVACANEALRDIATLPGEPLIFLNIHPAVLSGPELIGSSILAAALRHGVQPSRIVLEITEQANIDDLERCMLNIELLREAGVRFAFDDVGVAYSHLIHIDRIRPSFLKISQDFGTSFETEIHKMKIVRNITALAHDFGCEVILEGIETQASADAAREIGVELLQGFLFGRPLPAAELVMVH
ncbi:MAG TPA: EAL domain-containing response regulator [Thermoanaerobaculia bacterium]|nr:EAL domain-containing response regulator [Thermoanaerobaculia bacterium]